jgi:hypothetical protein
MLMRCMPLCEEGKIKDSLRDGDSNTMETLRDGQVKHGATRHEHYSGSQKRMVNQMRTGTVSCHTLLNVLGRRSEHLWVFPVFKDDNRSTND